MQNQNKAIFYSLFLIISSRCFIVFFPSLGLSFLSTIMVALGELSLYYCLYRAGFQSILTGNRSIIYLFIVYTAFLTVQLYLFPQASPSLFMQVPESLGPFLRSSFDILALMLLSSYIAKYLNFVKFAMLTTILVVLFIIIYQLRVGFGLYSIMYGISLIDRENFKLPGFIGALSMNGFLSLLFASSLYLSDKWSERKKINKLITSVLIVLCLFLQLIMVERGPFLFTIVTLIFYLMAKGIISVRYTIVYIIVFVVITIFSSELISIVEHFFPAMSDKLSRIESEGGSGRFGSDESLFSLAFMQIVDNPWIGLHCRILDPSGYGIYPHNLILEYFMTGGCVLGIPLCYLLWKAFKQSYNLIKDDRVEALFAILFIHRSLCLLTSASTVTNLPFWFSFAFVLSTIYAKKEKKFNLNQSKLFLSKI